MTDIFKSADWAREGLEREAAAKRLPYMVTPDAVERLLNDPAAMRELLKPGGLIVVESSELFYGGPAGGSMSS